MPTMRAGQRGTVTEVSVSEAAAKRLADLGFLPGARVEMIQPGAPCILRIGGARVGLGSAHQCRIRLAVD